MAKKRRSRLGDSLQIDFNPDPKKKPGFSMADYEAAVERRRQAEAAGAAKAPPETSDDDSTDGASTDNGERAEEQG